MNNDHEALARDVLMLEGGTAATLEPVTIGLSEAAVFRAAQAGHAPRYVKAATGTAAAALRDEIARTKWLAARGISVPRLLRVENRGDSIAVLMAAIAGQPADETALPTPRLVDALAKALAALHALPPDQCPFDETLATRLKRAAAAIAEGGVDPAEFEPRNRRIAPAALLRRLQNEQPRDDIVVLHGDATLGNIIVDDDGALGFIDCGNAGRGDRYTDLALLHADLVGHRGKAAGAQFLEAYGAGDFDTARARYFLDLYELF
ncbi:MAG: APH(3') family aminoglycoside O-phosphotransferase [Pseudolabrys sp.]|nr:APH(3') family aminoglycoside O-phosphotransferase [Pseudolabrys sp.]MDP2298002.1 APH(3') family aminoglycoside O-phosphotransferase [Pseudolabrys sp.]